MKIKLEIGLYVAFDDVEFAAGEPGWIDTAQDNVRVGHGRGGATTGVARGSWIGPGAIRADGDAP